MYQMRTLGVYKNSSLNMWQKYFPYAFIYGIDINISYSGPRFTLLFIIVNLKWYYY